MNANPLIFLEAATGLEPVNNGFADRSLATWVCRLRFVNGIYRIFPTLSRGFKRRDPFLKRPCFLKALVPRSSPSRRALLRLRKTSARENVKMFMGAPRFNRSGLTHS